jgi:hypothetical protein
VIKHLRPVYHSFSSPNETLPLSWWLVNNGFVVDDDIKDIKYLPFSTEGLTKLLETIDEQLEANKYLGFDEQLDELERGLKEETPQEESVRYEVPRSEQTQAEQTQVEQPQMMSLVERWSSAPTLTSERKELIEAHLNDFLLQLDDGENNYNKNSTYKKNRYR